MRKLSRMSGWDHRRWVRERRWWVEEEEKRECRISTRRRLIYIKLVNEVILHFLAPTWSSSKELSFLVCKILYALMIKWNQLCYIYIMCLYNDLHTHNGEIWLLYGVSLIKEEYACAFGQPPNLTHQIPLRWLGRYITWALRMPHLLTRNGKGPERITFMYMKRVCHIQ